MKKAIITGITGQDGSYLAEFLLHKGYEVHGFKRRSSTFNTARVDHLVVDEHEHESRFHMHFGDLTDSGQLAGLIYDIQPDEIYNLAAQSHVKVSFDLPEYTGDVTGLGTTRLLDAVRRSGSKARFYQASTSELFGASPPPQSEVTAFHPRSPYGVAKLYSYWITVNYRESYGLYACNGILFNHESPRRGETFVTRKITRAVASILAGRQKGLWLGNLDAKRDWGFAPDYVVCQWKMLQQDRPEDIAIGTGEAHSVRDFVEEAFAYAGIDLEWQGDGTMERGVVRTIDKAKVPDTCTLEAGSPVVQVDERYYRPAEVGYLLADPSKAKRLLKWSPRVKFGGLVRIMMDADLEAMEITSPGEGRNILKNNGYLWIKNNEALAGVE